MYFILLLFDPQHAFLMEPNQGKHAVAVIGSYEDDTIEQKRRLHEERKKIH